MEDIYRPKKHRTILKIMENRCEYTSKRFEEMVSKNYTNETIMEMYNEWADTYDDDARAHQSQGDVHVAKAAFEHCPSIPNYMKVLDIGCGTGRVAEQLKLKGFKHIDGLDLSRKMIEKAQEKGIYKTMYCTGITKDPLDIPNGTYDIIVSNGAFIGNHLPYDCLYEMIRLVKPGGIICIVTRTSTFTSPSTYKESDNLVSLIRELESLGKWNKLRFEQIPQYNATNEGTLAVFKVL